MATYQLLLPRMGESVSEATIVKWLKQPGDRIEADEPVLEIATDKVDSDVPSPYNGVLLEQLVRVDEVARVGDVVAVIEIEGADEAAVRVDVQSDIVSVPEPEPVKPAIPEAAPVPPAPLSPADEKPGRFYSPLVKNIAAEEGISEEELAALQGTGAEGRLTKQDVLDYLAMKKAAETVPGVPRADQPAAPIVTESPAAPHVPASPHDEIIEMDRMRRIIADHMVHSVHTAPHVCSFVEADVTNIVQWRNRVKEAFEKREGTKITFTPIFIEATAKALRDFPMVNISVNGTQIIKKKNINIGMAAALPTGNLIVPVIRNADQLNLVGLAKAVNDLASRARANKLQPDETQGGTFTLTNIGAFGNIMGTPIINQPQVAILAVGTITKKPAVIETEYGDVIGIRHMMYLSMSYDHRVVDGALGGTFLRRVADYLENWDVHREP